MGLYQPRNLIPYLQCINASENNTFSCQINGTKCTSYLCEIWDDNNNLITSATPTQTPLTQPLYNGEVLSFEVPTTVGLENGVNYKWKVKLYQDTFTMLKGAGTITGSSNLSIGVPPLDEEEKELIYKTKYRFLKIGDAIREVTSFDYTLNRFYVAEKFANAPINGTQVQILKANDEGEAGDVILTTTTVNSTVTDLCLKPNTYVEVGDKIHINGLIKTISAYDEDTFIATISEALSAAPAWGVEYSIYTDHVTSTPESPFYCRSVPTISIEEVETINNRNYEFTGSYSQTENVGIKFHKWKLWSVEPTSNEKILVEETEDIYSADLRFAFNEFRNNTYYELQLTIEDEFDRIFDSSLLEFYVSYTSPDVDVKPVATFLPDRTGIRLQWGNTADFEGTITQTLADGTTQVIQGGNNYIIDGVPRLGVKSLAMPENAYAEWRGWTKEDRAGVLDVPETFCISWYQKFESTFEGDIMRFTRVDDNGQSHEYSITLPPETDIENKYKFLYNLDGVEGEYIWDRHAQEFCLQATSQINAESDYVFADTLNNETQIWSDNKFFVENGTRSQRLSKHWWKFVMTNNSLTVQKGSD